MDRNPRVALDGLEGKIRALEVWLILGIDVAQRNNVEDRRMGHAMRELGWERKQRRYGGNPEWSYIKGEGEERINVERDLATKDVLIIQGEQWWRIAWGTTQRVVYRDEKPKHEEDAA